MCLFFFFFSSRSVRLICLIYFFPNKTFSLTLCLTSCLGHQFCRWKFPAICCPAVRLRNPIIFLSTNTSSKFILTCSTTSQRSRHKRVRKRILLGYQGNIPTKWPEAPALAYHGCPSMTRSRAWKLELADLLPKTFPTSLAKLVSNCLLDFSGSHDSKCSC